MKWHYLIYEESMVSGADDSGGRADEPDTRRTFSAGEPFAQSYGVAATDTSPSERIRHDSVKTEL